MIKNPIYLRLEKLNTWQLRTFMVCLCERMYPNYQFYQKHVGGDEEHCKLYKNLLDLVWETLTVKNAKINFDSQLEKLEEIIPTLTDESPYSISPAIDACQALSELIHSYISGEIVPHAVKISSISAQTVAEFEMTKADQVLNEETLTQFQPVIDEFDIQWEIFRVIRAESDYNIELIRSLKYEIREELISNIGIV